MKGIAEEIMKSDDVVFTWHDDGSKKKSVGSFCVNGITIEGIYRALPTLSVATESCENLAEMKKCVLQMLEISSGISAKDLFEKVDFRVMDSTSHNYHVDEKVNQYPIEIQEKSL